MLAKVSLLLLAVVVVSLNLFEKNKTKQKCYSCCKRFTKLISPVSSVCVNKGSSASPEKCSVCFCDIPDKMSDLMGLSQVST